MRARELEVNPCELGAIRSFVEEHHYSHNINGVKVSYAFEVRYDGDLVGAVIFGQMSTTAWKKFGSTEESVLELRRLVLVDAAERNSESRVIGWTLNWLRKNAPLVDVIVSYADPFHGHLGTIYKASNFKYVGLSGKDFGYRDENGKVYHSRALRTKYKGEYKPFVRVLRQKLSDGLLERVELPGKHCFVYQLRNRPKHG